MKKVILLASIAPLFITFSAVASETMSNEELTRVVCNHLEQTEQVKTAISRAYSETKSITNNAQKNTLKQLASGRLDVDAFCSNIQI